jgi:manganese transport protein
MDNTARDAEKVLDGSSSRGFIRRLLPFLGPAFIASIAYVDPGNFATNIQAGSTFGYTLIWVIFASNLMAMLIQTLSAKLGIVTGHNLAELCRMRLQKPVVMVMWVLMELVAMATDLAEFLGAALGFNLLFGFPLIVGGLLTALATYLILGLERWGFRSLEAVITVFLAVIAVCYLAETILDQPDWAAVGFNLIQPRFVGPNSVVLAAGILGATVMPHAIFLHSALTQGRIKVKDAGRMRRLFHYEIADVVIAMGLASLVNAAMLIMAAATFHRSGITDLATIEQAYKTLEPLLGPAASWVFGISLLASGLSSSAVGTNAGQIIMQGFLEWHVPVWLRRFITILPALAVILLGFDPTGTLVLSQVVLSFGLPFVIVPLVMFTSDRKLMGPLTNRAGTTVLASLVAAVIIGLNAYLLYQTFFA